MKQFLIRSLYLIFRRRHCVRIAMGHELKFGALMSTGKSEVKYLGNHWFLDCGRSRWFACSADRHMGWLRVFGVGFAWKNTDVHKLCFSERYGHINRIQIGKWSVKALCKTDKGAQNP